MNAKKILLQLTVLTLFMSMFTEFTSSAQEAPGATVWIKIHRIQAVDQIETASEDGADWRYRIWVYTGQIYGELWIIENFTAEPNHDDITVDKIHRFDNVTATITTVIVDLFEDDPLYYATADISSSIPESGPGISVSGKRFRIRYDLTSNAIVEGDEVIFEGEYYKTSGEFDDRVASDEYDANLWFVIWDSLGPNAYFTYAPTNPTVGEDVRFTVVFPDPEAKFTSWLWDFGDGSTSDLKNPVHKYAKAGTYTVNLTVTDYNGVTTITSQTIAIKGSSWVPLVLVLIVIAIVGVGIVLVKRFKPSKWWRNKDHSAHASMR